MTVENPGLRESATFDRDTIWEADHVIDLGPGAGRHGGYIVAEGTPKDVAKNSASLTGQYMSGRREIPLPKKRRTPTNRWVTREARPH